MILGSAAKQRDRLEGGFDLKEGVYASMLGPSYETPAEVEMLAGTGQTQGMSTALEVIAARHAGARARGLSCITNPAAGKSETRPMRMEGRGQSRKGPYAVPGQRVGQSHLARTKRFADLPR